MTTTTKSQKHGFRDMRTEILRRRYLWKDEHGKVIEAPEQMFRRVANVVAAIESKYEANDDQVKIIADEFYKLMADGVFLPNSPTLMSAGREQGMLSACVVLPVEDSIIGIFDTIKNAAVIQKADCLSGFFRRPSFWQIAVQHSANGFSKSKCETVKDKS